MHIKKRGQCKPRPWLRWLTCIINRWKYGFLRVLAGFAEAEVWPVTDLLEISSLQGLVSHLTEVHVAVVMTLFPLKTSAQTHALTRPLTYTEHCKPSAQSHECVYKLSDRAVRPGRWFPGSSPVTTSCWNPDGSGSKTGCRRGNLGKQQSNDDGKSFFFFFLCPHTFDVSELSRLG